MSNSLTPTSLAGRVALVTGGSSGIGRAAALAFAAAGATVVVADIAVPGGEEAVAAIRAHGGEALFVRADVSQARDVDAMAAATVDRFGRLDYAFNNAGIEGQWPSSIVDYPEDVWDRVMAVNLKGVWLCMKAEIPIMLAQGGGAIVNTASIAGLIGTPVIPAYGASKHGVVSLTKSAALGYAQQGIRVNAVCPAFIKTPMLDRAIENTPGLEERSRTMQPVGRAGRPEEVAATVVWLCSDAASFITGVAMPVDGGYTAT